jgi:predicted dehydrogenase
LKSGGHSEYALNMTTQAKLRWGILGTAQIARKNWKGIANTGNGTIVAVASRDLARSQQFIKECQAAAPFETVPKALGSYESVLAAKDVDAVYIPLPTGVRKQWVIRAAEAGKHIVCEKPCGATVEEVQEMVGACRKHGVQFMDGVMFMHSRRLGQIRAVLDDKVTMGQVKHIASAFSFCAPDEFFDANIRAQGDLEPLGCLGDLGWYCVRLALWVMNWKLPREVTGRVLSQLDRKDGRAPVPTEFSAELLFEGGLSSAFYCSFLAANQQWANISGTRGYIHLADFVVPFFGSETAFDVQNTIHRIRGCDFNMEEHRRRVAVAEYSSGDVTSQEANLFRNFAAQVQSGALNNLWPEMALKTQQVVNACVDSACSHRPVELNADVLAT